MKRSQLQHFENKFHRYNNVKFDENNIDKYIHVIRNNKLNYDYITVKNEKIKTSFVGKYETIEEMEENIYNVESHPIVIGGRKNKRTKLTNGNNNC